MKSVTVPTTNVVGMPRQHQTWQTRFDFSFRLSAPDFHKFINRHWELVLSCFSNFIFLSPGIDCVQQVAHVTMLRVHRSHGQICDLCTQYLHFWMFLISYLEAKINKNNLSTLKQSLQRLFVSWICRWCEVSPMSAGETASLKFRLPCSHPGKFCERSASDATSTTFGPCRELVSSRMCVWRLIPESHK